MSRLTNLDHLNFLFALLANAMAMIVSIVAITFIPTIVYAAAIPITWEGLSQPVFSTIDAHQGLPHRLAMSAAQDQQGFIWIGTQDGLARWDGYRTRVYKHNKQDVSSLPEPFVYNLTVDIHGRLWVATISGKIARFDPVNDSFESFPMTGIGIGSAPRLTGDNKGRIWVIGQNGLFVLEPETRHWTRIDAQASGLPKARFTSILVTQSGTIYVASIQGLYQRPANRTNFTIIPTTEKLRVSSVRGLSAGKIMFGTQDGLVGIIDAASGLVSANYSVGFPAYIRDLVEVTPGHIWCPSYSTGLIDLNLTSGHARQFLHDKLNSHGLPSNSLFAALKDRSGAIWIAGEGGVIRSAPAHESVKNLLPSTQSRTGLIGESVTAMLPVEGGAWLGFENGLMQWISSQGAAINHAVPTNQMQDKQPDIPGTPPIYALARAPDSNLWIGTLRGLYIWTPDNSKIKLVEATGTTPITSLLIDGETIWVGSTIQGLIHLSLNGKVIASYRHDTSGETALGDNTVTAIVKDPDGLIWIGTGNGLDRLNPATAKVQHFAADEKRPDSLPANRINALFLDHSGQLWVGTLGGGVGVLNRNPSGLRFTHLDQSNGLPGNNIESFVEDTEHRIWISTSSSLAMVDRQTLAVRVLTEMDGATIEQYWGKSSALIPGVGILFGGAGGASLVQPDRIFSADYEVPVLVTDARIDGKHVDSAAEILVKPGMRRLQFEFAALDYASPANNRYIFRLSGFDKDWTETDASHRIASYTNLLPGNYELQFKGSNSMGHWSEQLNTIRIRVLPAWYQTNVFYVIALCASLSAIFASTRLYILFRTAALLKRQAQLENIVHERTTELAASRDEAKQAQYIAESAERAIRALFDHADQGFMTVNSQLIIGEQCSASCIDILGSNPSGGQLSTRVFRECSQSVREGAVNTLTSIFQDEQEIRRNLKLELLPKEIHYETRIVELAYKWLSKDDGVMIIMTDVTHTRELTEQLAKEQSRLEMIVLAITENREFIELEHAYRHFLTTAFRQLCDASRTDSNASRQLAHLLHTYKGGLAQFSFPRSPKHLHRIESDFNEGQTPDDAESALLYLLDQDVAEVTSVLGPDFFAQGARVTLTDPFVHDIEIAANQLLNSDLVASASSEARAVLSALANLRTVEVSALLGMHARAAKRLAQQLGRPMQVKAESNEKLRVPPSHQAFLRSLLHIFRNAVYHGIEPARARVAQEKPEAMTLNYAVGRRADGYQICIEDDGCGIDYEALIQKRIQLGEDESTLRSMSIASLFAFGLSTTDAVEEAAGRGFGMTAVLSELTRLGGNLNIDTEPGRFTRFVFAVPLASASGTENI